MPGIVVGRESRWSDQEDSKPSTLISALLPTCKTQALREMFNVRYVSEDVRIPCSLGVHILTVQHSIAIQFFREMMINSVDVHLLSHDACEK